MTSTFHTTWGMLSYLHVVLCNSKTVAFHGSVYIDGKGENKAKIEGMENTRLSHKAHSFPLQEHLCGGSLGDASGALTLLP